METLKVIRLRLIFVHILKKTQMAIQRMKPIKAICHNLRVKKLTMIKNKANGFMIMNQPYEGHGKEYFRLKTNKCVQNATGENKQCYIIDKANKD